MGVDNDDGKIFFKVKVIGSDLTIKKTNFFQINFPLINDLLKKIIHINQNKRTVVLGQNDLNNILNETLLQLKPALIHDSLVKMSKFGIYDMF